MSLMRTTDFSELLDTPLRKIFYLWLRDSPPEYVRWAHIIETQRNFEDDLRMAEFGAIPAHAEGDAVSFEDAVQGETRRYTPLEYQLGYIITEQMREDDQHGVMVRMTQALRRSVRNLYEVEAYKILNNATSVAASRYKGFDTLALLNTAHTNVGGGTQSNRPTTMVDLSTTAVEAAVKAFHGFTGEKGLPILVTPSLAIVSGQDQYLAARIFKNATQFDTANREENWIKQGPDNNGVSQYIASRYLTDTDSWFLLSDRADHDLNMFVRIQPQFQTNTEFTTGNFQVKCRTRLVSGFGHWLGVYGSTGG